MKDLQGRDINYMRISITDRCNLRCKYCMPDGIELLPMNEILTFEEILRWDLGLPDLRLQAENR